MTAGHAFMAQARASGATILPVDSEHNAVFQILDGPANSEVATVTLTASGGPFRDWDLRRMACATIKEACAHPNWAMGAKISVDSATLMNKGLELIEAAHLFALTHEQLGVVIHRQSLVHALIEFVDGSIHAQMGAADMRLPIAHVLAYPERLRWRAPKLNLAQIGSLTFEAPDLSRFPALALAQACLRQGGGYPTILNAANEVAVEAFLNGRLPFLGVAEVCERVLNGFPHMAQSDHLDLAAILALDLEARHAARSAIAQSSTPISHIH